jgi:hypothetical protein
MPLGSPCSAWLAALGLVVPLALGAPGGALAANGSHGPAAEASRGEATPDWPAVADADTVRVHTTDPDGRPRHTTVWLVVHDGHGYVRTGGTHWGANVLRQPDVGLTIGHADYGLRAVPVPQGPEYDAVMQKFREKYGLEDSLLSLFRGGEPKIFRLESRSDTDATS